MIIVITPVPVNQHAACNVDAPGMIDVTEVGKPVDVVPVAGAAGSVPGCICPSGGRFTSNAGSSVPNVRSISDCKKSIASGTDGSVPVPNSAKAKSFI